MLTYWELYVAYVNRCVEDNYKNDIDPAHYEMEWNHWLPLAAFPDLPLGQWLTLRQHAIASALQSLALGKNCMCTWHKVHLPEPLLESAWPIYCEACAIRAAKLHEEKDENGKSIHAVKMGKKSAEKLHEEKDENGKSIHAVKMGKKGGKKSAEKLHEEKDELGRSVRAMKWAVRINEEKDELGRSVNAVKGGKKAAAITNEEKDEDGKSVNAVKGGKKGAAKTNNQVWESTVDGFRSNAANVARYNRARGWPADARVRIS